MFKRENGIMEKDFYATSPSHIDSSEKTPEAGFYDRVRARLEDRIEANRRLMLRMVWGISILAAVNTAAFLFVPGRHNSEHSQVEFQAFSSELGIEAPENGLF